MKSRSDKYVRRIAIEYGLKPKEVARKLKIKYPFKSKK